MIDEIDPMKTKLLILSKGNKFSMMLNQEEAIAIKELVVELNNSNTENLGFLTLSGPVTYMKILRVDPMMIKDQVTQLLIKMNENGG